MALTHYLQRIQVNESDRLYQPPLDHSEIPEVVLGAGQVCSKACPGSCFLISGCLEQMAKA